MAKWTRYQAKWSKEVPGEARLAIDLDGIVFTTKLTADHLIPQSMVEALCDVTSMSVRGWVARGKLKIAQKYRGRARYRVGDVYPIAKDRGLLD